MADETMFFLAPYDAAAASTYLCGPSRGFAFVSCRWVEPDTAIAEWDMYFVERSAEMPSRERLFGWRPWPEYVTPPLNDGVEIFALPLRLTRALASAGAPELEELANRWTERLRASDGDEMTDDDPAAVLQGVAGLAVDAQHTGGGLYGWSY